MATLVFLPGESHGQRSLVGYSPWACKETDTTGRLTLDTKRCEVISHCDFDVYFPGD